MNERRFLCVVCGWICFEENHKDRIYPDICKCCESWVMNRLTKDRRILTMAYSKAFEDWYAENKKSDYLRSCYDNYCLELNSMGEKPASFKKWCFESEWLSD